MNYFITGTDTNVGKTVTSAILALKYQYHYWKPIQTGSVNDSDSLWVKQFLKKGQVLPSIYSFKAPLSPHLAAEIEGQEICLETIKAKFPKEKTIIEGIGGLLVPLTPKYQLIDLIPKKDCRIILVARSNLGTINHTLLSIEALKKRKLSLWGVVMVGDQNDQNKVAIEKYGKTKIIAQIPFLVSMTKANLQHQAVQFSMEKNQ
jgi:dethiobiotin synthase